MKNKKLFVLGFIIAPLIVLAATFTISTSGNWSSTGTWSGGVLPGTIDDVAMNNGRSVTIQSGDDYTVQSLNANNNNTVTIDFGGKLTLSNTGNDAFIAGNNAIINVDGTLIIDGNLVIDNQLTLNITGTMIVTGDIILKNNATLDVASGGSLSVDGDFTGGNGTDVTVDGNMNVAGTIDTGNGSTLVGTGTVTSGDCTGEPIFCAGAPMPVELMYFNATTNIDEIELLWATASEENFDYFSLERSSNGVDFKEIAQIQGMGDSFKRVDYEFTDDFPLKGISYYRLRSIDFDGYTEIFDYVMVEVEGARNDFSVYPNPVQNGQFSLQTNFTDEAELIIYNNVGKIEEQLSVNEWLSDYSLNLQPGSYLFKLITNKGIVVKRVLVK